MIELNKINKYYTNEEESLHVLKDIQLSIKKGEMIAIMGPSGSGKSTLINLLGFIDRKFEGEYLFEGRSFRLVSGFSIQKMTFFLKSEIKQ